MIDIGNLPTGWAIESLNGLCILNPRHDKTLSDNLDVSFIPMAAVDEKTGTISADVECRKLGKVRRGYTHFADGDVIFAKITPCMENGKSAIAENLYNGLACGSTEFYTLRSNGAISPQYLHPFLRQNSYIDNASMNMTGVVGQRRVPKNFILSTQIPLAPLNEQKRIVAKIEALQTRSSAVKEELEAIKPLLNQFRQSVLAAAFRGDLTKDWRKQNPNVEPAEVLLERIRIERRRRWEEAELEKMKAKGKVPKDDKWKKKYKEPESIDSEDLLELPDGWCYSCLQILADVIDPNPSHRMPKYVNLGISFISTENFVEPEYIDFSIGKQVGRETLDKQRKSYLIEDGDFALSRIGTIGKTRFLPINQEYCLSHALVIIKPLSFFVYPRFLKSLVSSDIVLQQAKSGVQSVGVPDLGMGKIRGFSIPLAPLKEQKEIVRRIESLFKLADSIEQQYQQAEVDLETLNQSILAKAFRGELVPQDPNDEPASVLLERIKEERDRAKPKETKKKKSSKKKDKQLDIPGI